MQNSIYKKTVAEKCCYSLLRIYRNLLFTHTEAGEDLVDHASVAFSPVSSSNEPTAHSAQTFTASRVTPLSRAATAWLKSSIALTQQLRCLSLVRQAAFGSKASVESTRATAFSSSSAPLPERR